MSSEESDSPRQEGDPQPDPVPDASPQATPEYARYTPQVVAQICEHLEGIHECRKIIRHNVFAIGEHGNWLRDTMHYGDFMAAVAREFGEGYHDTLLRCADVFKNLGDDRFRILRNLPLQKTILYDWAKTDPVTREAILADIESGVIPQAAKPLNSMIRERLDHAALHPPPRSGPVEVMPPSVWRPRVERMRDRASRGWGSPVLTIPEQRALRRAQQRRDHAEMEAREGLAIFKKYMPLIAYNELLERARKAGKAWGRICVPYRPYYHVLDCTTEQLESFVDPENHDSPIKGWVVEIECVKAELERRKRAKWDRMYAARDASGDWQEQLARRASAEDEEEAEAEPAQPQEAGLLAALKRFAAIEAVARARNGAGGHGSAGIAG